VRLVHTPSIPEEPFVVRIVLRVTPLGQTTRPPIESGATHPGQPLEPVIVDELTRAHVRDFRTGQDDFDRLAEESVVQVVQRCTVDIHDSYPRARNCFNCFFARWYSFATFCTEQPILSATCWYVMCS